MKKKILSDDTLLVDVIAITGTREEAQKFIKDKAVTEELRGIGYCVVLPNNGGFLVWVQNPKDFYVLLHECIHLVNFIFDSKGMNTNLSNEDETFAYFVSYWFRRLWRFYGNLKKEKRK